MANDFLRIEEKFLKKGIQFFLIRNLSLICFCLVNRINVCRMIDASNIIRLFLQRKQLYIVNYINGTKIFFIISVFISCTYKAFVNFFDEKLKENVC